jgi:hypothetical protein
MKQKTARFSLLPESKGGASLLIVENFEAQTLGFKAFSA